MPDEKTKHHNPAAPDIHPGNLGPFLCHRLGVPGVIVLLSHENGSIEMLAHNVIHARANEMMSRGMQINLNQLDEAVAAAEAAKALKVAGLVGGVQ